MSWALFTRTHAIIDAKGGDIKIETGSNPGEIVLTIGQHMVTVKTEDLMEAVSRIRNTSFPA